MASILYYSNYCKYCSKILVHISKTKLKETIHFVNIDNRYKEGEKIHIILPNGKTLSMPPHVTKVPALMLVDSYNVMYGDDIYRYLKPKEERIKNIATKKNGEPLAFSLEMGASLSDCYSFLDMTPEELSAKGGGGMRQMHHFAKPNNKETIETPTENYSPDKVGNVDMDKLQQQRLEEIRMTK